jgi:hypothetical protein
VAENSITRGGSKNSVVWKKASSADAAPPAKETLPPALKARLVHALESEPESKSSASVGFNSTSPSSPSRVWPARVSLCVPAANSSVRESTSAPGGVRKVAGALEATGDVAELPALSDELTRKW